MTAPDVRALLDADAERAGKVKTLAGAATEGPWEYVGRNVIDTPPIEVDEADWGSEGHSGLRVHTAQDTRAYRYADAEFIAASRTETPWLVERLRARDAAIRAVLARVEEFERRGAGYREDEYEDGVRHAYDWAAKDLRHDLAALASALGGGEQQ